MHPDAQRLAGLLEAPPHRPARPGAPGRRDGLVEVGRPVGRARRLHRLAAHHLDAGETTEIAADRLGEATAEPVHRRVPRQVREAEQGDARRLRRARPDGGDRGGSGGHAVARHRQLGGRSGVSGARTARPGQRVEPGHDGLHVGQAVVGPLGQEPPEQGVERRRQVAAPGARRRRVLRQDGVEQRRLVGGRERVPPGQRLVEHHAERPDVGAPVGRLATDLLRRGVGEGADGGPGTGQPRHPGAVGEAEVEDLHPPVGGEEEVGGLDVAVHDAAGVGGAQARRDLAGEGDRRGGQHGAAVEALAQGLALVERHRQERRAVVGLADLVEGADRRVVQRRGGPRFVQEAAAHRLVGELGGQELQRHQAAELAVARLVDDAHASGTEAGEDLVASDLTTDHGPAIIDQPSATIDPSTSGRRTS